MSRWPGITTLSRVRTFSTSYLMGDTEDLHVLSLGACFLRPGGMQLFGTLHPAWRENAATHYTQHCYIASRWQLDSHTYSHMPPPCSRPRNGICMSTRTVWEGHEISKLTCVTRDWVSKNATMQKQKLSQSTRSCLTNPCFLCLLCFTSVLPSLFLFHFFIFLVCFLRFLLVFPLC